MFVCGAGPVDDYIERKKKTAQGVEIPGVGECADYFLLVRI